MKLSKIKERIIKNMLNVKSANEDNNFLSESHAYPPLDCDSVEKAKEIEESYLISLEMREENLA